MKQILVLAIISITLFACSSSSGKKEKANLVIAEKYMQAVETKNVELMSLLLADNYKGYGPSVDDSVNKEQAISAFRENSENLYESLKYTRHKELAVTVNEGDAQGDWVLNWAYLTIKYKVGSEPVHVWVSVAYRIENGKIVHSRTFYNEADVLRQLHFMITPPQAEMK